MRQRAAIPIALLAVALCAGGCGGGGKDDGGGGGASTAVTDRGGGAGADQGDVREIRAVVERFVLGRDAHAACRELSTRDLIQRIFGDIPQCEKAARSDQPGDKPPTGVRISGVTVDSDSATSRVRLVGGDSDGAAGVLELRRQQSRWRVDDYGVDLLRSLLRTSLQRAGKKQALLRRADVRRCVVKSFDDLSDDDLKRIAYLSISERPGSERDALELMVPCLTRAGSGKAGQRSILRESFEKGIARSARKDGLSRATLDCIVARLRRTVSERELGRLVTRKEETTARLTRKVARALLGCRSNAPPSTPS